MLRFITTIAFALLLLGCTTAAPVPHLASEWPGFASSPHFGEWVRDAAFDPDARVVVNVAADYDPAKPTHVIFYGTPNGNSIEWTLGRKMEEGMDWHYDIQHIAAQTRMLREAMPETNLVLVVMSPQPLSWPAWRSSHENSNELIQQLLETAFPEGGPDQTWTLTGHSGGGSFTFGYLNGVEEIDPRIKRIATLDSNYAYDNDEHHGDKLLAWLNSDPENTLAVVCYDDRYITWEGERLLSPTGGTYRATTERMMSRLRDDLEFTGDNDGHFISWRSMDGQVDIRVHPNPNNRILHTEMIGEMNAYLHVMTTHTPLEGKVADLAPGRAYMDWVQDGE